MRVDVNGVRIFFEVVGTKLAIEGPRMREKPTLVLLHGGPGINDHSAYRPMFESLADVAQLILIDHRGNGRSDRGSRAQWNLAQWGDDLREVPLRATAAVAPGSITPMTGTGESSRKASSAWAVLVLHATTTSFTPWLRSQWRISRL